MVLPFVLEALVHNADNHEAVRWTDPQAIWRSHTSQSQLQPWAKWGFAVETENIESPSLFSFCATKKHQFRWSVKFREAHWDWWAGDGLQKRRLSWIPVFKNANQRRSEKNSCVVLKTWLERQTGTQQTHFFRNPCSADYTARSCGENHIPQRRLSEHAVMSDRLGRPCCTASDIPSGRSSRSAHCRQIFYSLCILQRSTSHIRQCVLAGNSWIGCFVRKASYYLEVACVSNKREMLVRQWMPRSGVWSQSCLGGWAVNSHFERCTQSKARILHQGDLDWRWMGLAWDYEVRPSWFPWFRGLLNVPNRFRHLMAQVFSCTLSPVLPCTVLTQIQVASSIGGDWQVQKNSYASHLLPGTKTLRRGDQLAWKSFVGTTVPLQAMEKIPKDKNDTLWFPV